MAFVIFFFLPLERERGESERKYLRPYDEEREQQYGEGTIRESEDVVDTEKPVQVFGLLGDQKFRAFTHNRVNLV